LNVPLLADYIFVFYSYTLRDRCTAYLIANFPE
jgi:hypothetical protein